MKNKLTFISCARSDFGLISNLYDSFVKEKIFNCSLVCTGTVQSNKYGYSKSDLLKLNQNIILIPNKGVSPGYKNILKNIYNNNLKLIEYLKEFQPRLVFILGDRIEAIHLGILVRMMNFPIAHLHGGESTTGVYDDYWRHALSKISSLHFVANSTYKKNLIKMGEKANKIHVVGAYGLENIRRIKKTFINKEYFKNKYKFTFNQNNFVVVFHSNTLNQNSNYRDFKIIFDTISKLNNTNVFISYPGYDVGSEKIIKYLKLLEKKRLKNVFIFKNLGNDNFLSLVKVCDLIIGNSSSGIIEVPYLNKPVINIGDRQRGRLRSSLVFDCECKPNSLKKKINMIIKLIKNKKLPKNDKVYGRYNASINTIRIIKKTNFDLIRKKVFF